MLKKSVYYKTWKPDNLHKVFYIFSRFSNLPSVLYSLRTLEIILASGNQVKGYYRLLLF